MKNKFELLAPAGNMECLKTAFYFGADAVYLSGKAYGLRAFADNFSVDDLAEAVGHAHNMNKKVYLTCNAVFKNSDFDGFTEYLKNVDQAGVDAVIVSDPGVVMTVKETLPDMPVHLSTQANTTNYMSVKFWQKIGVERVILAREATLEDIRGIKDAVSDMELEVFIHGAMCISYSGRCLFSSVTTGRSGNRGECAQPCRWHYTVKEVSGDTSFPVYEDESGTYLFNSKDLMMIEHLDKLMDAGVQSFKIEGRMKSAYYVASVVKLYRQEMDKIINNPEHYLFDKAVLKEMEKAGTREYTTGFFFGNPMADGQDTERKREAQKSVFTARVLGSFGGKIKIEQRNKFWVGDVLEVLSPDMAPLSFEVKDIVTEDGVNQTDAPHPKQVLYLTCPYDLQENDILRCSR